MASARPELALGLVTGVREIRFYLQDRLRVEYTTKGSVGVACSRLGAVQLAQHGFTLEEGRGASSNVSPSGGFSQ